MNLVQITAFRAVMDSASLSDAARKLGRTQPAVSLAIRSLEEALGLQLFERRGRQLIPVPEAHYLAAEAEEILKRLATVTRTMQSLSGGRSGSLSLTAMPGPAAFVFPRFVAAALENLDDVNLTITSRSSERIEELARSQSIDFGFCDAPREVATNSQYHIDLISAECFLAMPTNCALGEHSQIALSDLDDMPMGALQAGHTHQMRTEARFNESGLKFRKVIESQTFLPLLQFVRTGKCLAVVDPLSVVNARELRDQDGKILFRRLESSLRYDYAILSPVHRPLSQIAKRLRTEWRVAIFELLEAVEADPRWEATSSDFESPGE